MLEELYKKGYLNYSQLILDHSKALGLGADEAFLLIKILDYYSKNKNLSIEKISSALLMSSSKVDKLVASLMERGYYEIFLAYDHGVGKECVSFHPLFIKLEGIINQKEFVDEYDIEKANQYLTNKLNRVLTAHELEILQKLILEDHYTLEAIKTAVDKITTENRVLSMRSLTMTLSNQKQKLQLQKEAPAAFQDFVKKI